MLPLNRKSPRSYASASARELDRRLWRRCGRRRAAPAGRVRARSIDAEDRLALLEQIDDGIQARLPGSAGQRRNGQSGGPKEDRDAAPQHDTHL